MKLSKKVMTIKIELTKHELGIIMEALEIYVDSSDCCPTKDEKHVEKLLERLDLKSYSFKRAVK